MKLYSNKIWGFLALLLLSGCGGSSKKESDKQPTAAAQKEVVVPQFNADSAYQYVAEQVAFGPRVPNTEAHRATAAYLQQELQRHGATVQVQEANLRAYDNTTLQSYNIIGSFSPENKSRVLLFAHWDSRPYADHDPNPANHRTPIDGANDGASGVGVLLEIARQIGEKQPETGVDIIFFDSEDYGMPDFYEGEDPNSLSWALGSQYWARRPHKPGYRARYGILLDMVGGKDALFVHEGYSKHYASWLVDEVWSTADKLGYGRYFVQQEGGYITDDHLYVNQMGIPSIDIIQYDPTTASGFYPYWHTLGDTLDKIDRETLKAVGQTVLTVIYNE